MEHNRGCNRLQRTWQCPTRPPPSSCGRKWRSRVVAPHRGDMSVRAINPLSVISPKIEPRGWNRGGLSPVSPLIFLMGTHRLHRKQETSLSRTFFWEPHGCGLLTCGATANAGMTRVFKKYLKPQRIVQLARDRANLIQLEPV